MGAAGNVISHHGDRHRHPIHAGWRLSRLYAASIAVLAASGALDAVLRRFDSTDQNVAVPENMDLKKARYLRMSSGFNN